MSILDSLVVKIRLEFAQSNKGGNLVVVNGLTFRKENIINWEKTIWRWTEFDMRVWYVA